MEIMKLVWQPVSKGMMAETPVGYYCYWEHNDGTITFTSSFDKMHNKACSFNEAKEICQKDFEERIKQCINIIENDIERNKRDRKTCKKL